MDRFSLKAIKRWALCAPKRSYVTEKKDHEELKSVHTWSVQLMQITIFISSRELKTNLFEES